MSTAILDDYQITNYEVPVELIADEYDTYQAAETDIHETVASTILAHGEFEQTDRDAREYIKRRVTFDEGNLEHELEHDEADIIRVETVTRLAHLEGDGGADD